MIEIKGRHTTALLTIDEFEEQMVAQVYSMVNHMAFENKVAIMPDGHKGASSCIGFTMPLGKRLIPNVIGVDVGCSVLCANIGGKLAITLKELDDKIRRDIPMGTDTHEKAFKMSSGDKFSFDKYFPWKGLNDEIIAFILAYNTKFGTSFNSDCKYDYRDFGSLCTKIGMKPNRAELSIGTLGGGNHFIEVSESNSNGDIWVTIHSGSRNFGKMVCEYHQEKAKKNLDYNRNEVLKTRIETITKNTEDKSKISSLITEAKKELGLDFDFDIKGMEFLEGGAAFEYLIDMVVAQKYAQFNRAMMLNIICEILGGIKPIDTIESIHNYIDFRDFIIRKGAIRSYIGERMIIPFNMRDGILVCEGKSNSEWNNSAPHGAGRLMSRSKAKDSIDIDRFKKQMEGIYSTSVCNGTLDEAPDAYKDSKMIEEAIEPTATIIDRLIPILNIKDKNSGHSFKERKEEKRRTQEREAMRNLKMKKIDDKMNHLLEYKPYYFKERDDYEIVSCGKIQCEIYHYDVLFEGKKLFEYKGKKQVAEMVNLLNGAFVMGVSDSIVSNHDVEVKNRKPYSYKEVYVTSLLGFMGISGRYTWEIFFDNEKIETKGTKQQAKELVDLLNDAYFYGSIKECSNEIN